MTMRHQALIGRCLGGIEPSHGDGSVVLSTQSRGRSRGTFSLISRDFVSSCAIPTLLLVFSPRPATAVPEPPRQKVGPPQTKGRSFTGDEYRKGPNGVRVWRDADAVREADGALFGLHSQPAAF